MGYITTVVLTGLCITIASYLLKVQLLRARARSNGCRPAPRYKHWDLLFGIDEVVSTWKAMKEHRYLPELHKRYQEYGKTYESLKFGVVNVHSIEPDNIQCVWSTKADDWGVQPVRLAPMAPFCGRGFISTDGHDWERSRAMLRPSFNRASISDLSPLEASLQELMQHIPHDGATVDLSTLFEKFVNRPFSRQFTHVSNLTNIVAR